MATKTTTRKGARASERNAAQKPRIDRRGGGAASKSDATKESAEKREERRNATLKERVSFVEGLMKKAKDAGIARGDDAAPKPGTLAHEIKQAGIPGGALAAVSAALQASGHPKPRVARLKDGTRASVWVHKDFVPVEVVEEEGDDR